MTLQGVGNCAFFNLHSIPPAAHNAGHKIEPPATPRAISFALVSPFVVRPNKAVSLPHSNAQNLARLAVHFAGLINGAALLTTLGATLSHKLKSHFATKLVHIDNGIVGTVSPANLPNLESKLSTFCPALCRSTSAPFMSLCERLKKLLGSADWSHGASLDS